MPDSTSHSRMILSSPAAAAVVPSAEKARHRTWPNPSGGGYFLPVAASQTRTPFRPPAASHLPSGERARVRRRPGGHSNVCDSFSFDKFQRITSLLATLGARSPPPPENNVAPSGAIANEVTGGNALSVVTPSSDKFRTT